MKIILIRHGKTSGNLEKRYIGRTDEPLCCEGIDDITSRTYSQADVVISSSLKRCTETAKLIYPDKPAKICDGLRECDFGDFEGKNYEELSKNPKNVFILAHGSKTRFPNGETADAFSARSAQAFVQVLSENKDIDTVALIVHGGTIMSVMERFAVPQHTFYEYYTENGRGFIAEYSFETQKITDFSAI